MVSKSFKSVRITLVLNGSEDKIFISYNPLLEDCQVMVEQVEQPADEQDEEIDDNNNNSIRKFNTYIYNNSEEENEEEKEVEGIEFI